MTTATTPKRKLSPAPHDSLAATRRTAVGALGQHRPGALASWTTEVGHVEAGLNRMVKTIHKALASAEIDVEQIAGVGVGCPGPLDLERGVIRPRIPTKAVAMAAEVVAAAEA